MSFEPVEDDEGPSVGGFLTFVGLSALVIGFVVYVAPRIAEGAARGARVR